MMKSPLGYNVAQPNERCKLAHVINGLGNAIEAMKAARRGDVTTVGTPAKLLPSLNADC
jgi:hypothetical protein